MRIDELRLRAWGPFTDVTLDLSSGSHGLHLVLGANEAGKSSALRAITSLLFGISHQCGDAFLHENRALLIAAMLRSSRGETLSVTRRKGTKNTLLDAKDQPIPDGVFAAFLGGMGGELFKSLFGIDHEILRSGGDDLLKVSGNLGQAIVAASAGYRDLRGVLLSLDAEAESLYKSGRGKSPLINQALSTLKVARDGISRATVKWSKYDEALNAVTERESERDQLIEDILKLRANRNRLERMRDAIPLIAERKIALASIEGLGDVVFLPETFARDRMLLQQTLKTARAGELTASMELHGIEDSLKELCVPAGLLEQEQAISQLCQALGAQNKAADDLPMLQTRLAQCENDAQEILKDLGHPPSLDEVDALRLPIAVQVNIQDLASKHQSLQERLHAANETAVDLAADLVDAERHRAALGASVDVSELRAALARARDQGDLDKLRTRAARQLEEEAAIAETDLKKLGLWEGPVDRVESLPIPSDQTIDYFATELASIQSEARNRSDELQRADAEGASIDGKLRALQLAGAVPTEQELTSLREQRDQTWRALRKAWQGGDAHDPQRADGYEHRVEQADALADRLRRESGRVVELANLLADSTHNDDLRRTLRAQLVELEQRRDERSGDWAAIWAPAGIVALRPTEMRSWVQKHALLAKQVRDISAHHRELNAVDNTIEGLRATLLTQLRKLGEVDLPNGDEIGPVVRRATAVVDRNDDIQRERERLTSQIAQLEQKRSKAESRVTLASATLEAWNQSWIKAVGEARLRVDTSPAEANAVVVKILELVKRADEAAGYQRRIHDIHRDAKTFEGEVAALVGLLAPDLATLTATQAVAVLDTRLKQGTKNRARSDELEKQHAEREQLLNRSRTTIEQCKRELDEMCRGAGCATVDELPEVERQFAEVGRLRQLLSTLELQLRPLAAGLDLEQFVKEAEQENADALPADIEETDGRIREGETRRKKVEQDVGARKAELEKIQGGSEAADAAETAQSITAQIRGATDRYVRLRLAAAILRREIDAYRRQHQEPIMQRASELFSRLTAGSFQALRIGYDTDDEPIILGVRPSDKEVPIAGMSDGTRDQLYLSLRLASIEGYVDRNEPVPFVVDDVFVHFDDGRSAAALEILGNFSQKMQIIMFTHHPHLVEVARRAVAADVLFVHALGSPTS